MKTALSSIRSAASAGTVATCLAAVLLSIAGPARAQSATEAAAAKGSCPAVLQYSFKRLQDETPQNLCQYAGKVVLVVNTASYCGFTHQYEGLEALYAKYGSQGLVVLGFPSNDFGGQEPGADKQIADFCYNTYGVKFPMLSKSVVSGKDANPMYQTLGRLTGKTPGWNFHKYLIDRQGKAVVSYNSDVEPTSKALLAEIEKDLAAR